MTKDVVLYCFDTMADWEYAHITTVLTAVAREGDDRYRLRTASVDGAPVRTLGGLRLLPDGTLAEVDRAQVALLLLPGGLTWADGHEAALSLAHELLGDGIPVAGICGATKAMARAGLMARHAHTVDPEDTPVGYDGEHGRVPGAVAVLDGDLVTAVGEAPLEFSREVFRRLEIDSPEGIDEWYGVFKDVPDAR